MRQPKQSQLAPLISLNKLSNRSQSLRSLIKQAENRTSLQEVFNEVLPPAFKNKFQINSSEAGVLIISCQSAALMTKFRFSQEEVMQRLNMRIYPRKIDQIKIKVRPPTFNQDKKLKKTRRSQPLSKKNAQILRSEAEHTNDKKLKEALMRLAKHSASSSEDQT